MRLSEEVILLDSTKGSYCYLIMDDEPVLIDTSFGFKTNAILQELKSLHIEPTDIKHILLTHHDVDHTGGLKKLQEKTKAAVWAHEKDIPFITGEIDRPGFKKYIGKLNYRNRIKDIRPYGKDLSIGNVRIIETPGHTPGHVCMLYKEMFFVGDLLENKKGTIIPYPDFWNWNTAMMHQTIRDLDDLKFQWICTAHGKPVKQDYLPTPG